MKRKETLSGLFDDAMLAIEEAGDQVDQKLKPATFMVLQKLIEERIIRPLRPSNLPPKISFGWNLERYDRLLATDVREAYSQWAKVYGNQEQALFKMEEAELLPLAGEVRGKRILDVGCGTGRYAIQFAAGGGVVTGIDLCPEMLAVADREARKQNLDLSLFAGDFLSMEVPSGPYDLIFSSLAVTHFPVLSDFLGRLSPLLAENGKMIISDIHPSFKALGGNVGFLEGDSFIEIPHQWHFAADFFSAARQTGLTVVNIHEFPRLTVIPLMMAVQLCRETNIT